MRSVRGLGPRARTGEFRVKGKIGDGLNAIQCEERFDPTRGIAYKPQSGENWRERKQATVTSMWSYTKRT